MAAVSAVFVAEGLGEGEKDVKGDVIFLAGAPVPGTQ